VNKIEEAYMRALNRLGKWRSIYAGWQLGTKPDTDGPTKALRDNAEAKLILRVEVNAISRLLIEKGVITADEFMATITNECDEMQKMLENKFKGMKAKDGGMEMTKDALQTMKDLGFPP
jgi:hypothetical protein